MNRLALGTVQFGLDYGIKNTRGKVPLSEVEAILDLARRSGIDTLDTAAAYGNSESVLGYFLPARPEFRVVTKLPTVPQSTVRAEVEASLRRLGRPFVDGYLMHSFKTWQDNPALVDQLLACREAGLVRKIGISLYHPHEAMTLMDRGVPLDLVQVPYNLIDRRFESVFPLLAAYGTEIHVRSIFLQGIFFMDTVQLHPRFSPIAGTIRHLQRLACDSELGVAALCLGFVTANPQVTRLVIGVDGLADLKANLVAYARVGETGVVLADLGHVSCLDENIILPFNWSKS